ncbi:MAG: magnesium protoporphyrin IX methyltransferase [Rhodobacteraceae bacterium]|nr:magnesium protoporphyrin IX methyltransferase [Paracoccaceae bacterium]
MMDYTRTLSQVEDYFDRSATKVWEQLTSDAPVSRIRETVRAGRDEMRATMIGQLGDVRGKRILDAGCGTGMATEVLANMGAEVVGVDISPSLIKIAEDRMPTDLKGRVSFEAGDMTADRGAFDAIIAMDSLIYYTTPDLVVALDKLGAMTPKVVFTVAPRSAFLMAFWYAGKLFPRSDRSPVMVPQDLSAVPAKHIKTVRSGFYTSACMEVAYV